MFKENKYLYVVTVILLIFFLPAYVYGQEGEDLEKVGFAPFDSSLEVSPELAEKARLTLASAMNERGLFSPGRLDLWLNDNYIDEKAANLNQITETMKKVGYEIIFLCHGIMFKVGEQYGLKINLYSFDEKYNDSQYIRYFTLPQENMAKIDKKLEEICNQITDEIEKRVKEPKKPLFEKTLYIEKFQIKLIQIIETKGTGTKIANILPIIDLDGVEYKDTDHFFHEILLYRLHATRLFSLKSGNMSKYILNNATPPEDADFTVSGHLFIMENMNILFIDVKNQKTNEVIGSYSYPFTELTIQSLEAAMSKNALLIGLSVLELKEREKVGTAEIVLKEQDQEIFCNNYFLGNSDQTDLLLPFGQSDITIKDKMYKMFVYPFTKNYQYWEIDDSVITQILNIVEEVKSK